MDSKILRKSRNKSNLIEAPHEVYGTRIIEKPKSVLKLQCNNIGFKIL